MDSDKVNKGLWGEIQSKEFKTRKELVDFAEELLQCQFCMSIVTHPVTTHCTHLNVPSISRNYLIRSCATVLHINTSISITVICK